MKEGAETHGPSGGIRNEVPQGLKLCSVINHSIFDCAELLGINEYNGTMHFYV